MNIPAAPLPSESGDDDPLLATGPTADALGISAQSLQKWRRQGFATPAWVLPSGHARWRVEEVRDQLNALHGERRST